MDKVRVGLVGIGGMGYNHYCCHKNLETSDVVAVCDVRTDMAKEKTGGAVKIYSDLNEMLEKESLDMVDICTPTYLHAEMAKKCLEKGLHVLCEKPMTLDEKEADKLLAAVKRTDRNFMVAHVVRFMKPYAYLRKAIKSGENGKLLRLEMHRNSSVPLTSWQNWFLDESLSGGVVTDLSIHDLDFVSHVLGKPDEVSAFWRQLKDNSSYSAASMLYGDTLVSCEASWYKVKINFRAEFLAVFENAFIDFKDNKLYKNNEEVDLSGFSLFDELGVSVKGDNPYKDEIEYFIDCILKGRKPVFVSPESSASTIWLTDLVKMSATRFANTPIVQNLSQKTFKRT